MIKSCWSFIKFLIHPSISNECLKLSSQEFGRGRWQNIFGPEILLIFSIPYQLWPRGSVFCHSTPLVAPLKVCNSIYISGRKNHRIVSLWCTNSTDQCPPWQGKWWIEINFHSQMKHLNVALMHSQHYLVCLSHNFIKRISLSPHFPLVL